MEADIRWFDWWWERVEEVGKGEYMGVFKEGKREKIGVGKMMYPIASSASGTEHLSHYFPG